MTNDDTASRPPAPPVEESAASFDERTESVRFSHRPGDSAVARADLQRDETVR